MRRIALAGLLLAMTALSAHAEDDSGCTKFKWSIDKERAAFASPSAVASGADIAVGAGYRVALVAESDIAFAIQPERAPKTGTRGAVLKMTIAVDGVYDVTLSDEGWIDVAEDGTRVASSDFSGQKACPGVRKSVRFPLKAGAATLQLSNVDLTQINVAVEPAP